MWLAANMKDHKRKTVNVLKAEKSTRMDYQEQLEAFPLRYILVLLDERKLSRCTLYCQGC